MAAVVFSSFFLLLTIGTATMTVVHSREKLLELRPTIKSSRVAKDVGCTPPKTSRPALLYNLAVFST